MPPIDPYRHVPVLHVAIEFFSSEYPDVESRRSVLHRVQNTLTRAARPFSPEGDVWAE